MGAIPNKLPGGHDLDEDEARPASSGVGRVIPPEQGMHLSEMFEAMERGELRALYCIGENPAESEANATTPGGCWRAWTAWSSRTSSSPRRPSWPTSCFPRRRTGARRGHGHRLRAARPAGAQGDRPAGLARPDTHIICELADRMGHDWGEPTAEQVWDELRSLSLNWHDGMKL